MRVKRLLQEGANPNSTTELPLPPVWWKRLCENFLLWLGRLRGDLDMILANVRISSLLHPLPAIILATYESMPEEDAVTIITALLDHGANSDAQDGLGNTALLNAANDGKAKIIDLLLTRGANVNLANQSRYTPLYIASGSGNLVVVKRLLQSNPDIDAQSDFGTSPLMAACYDPSEFLVAKILLEAGANPHSKNRAGDDALAIARIHNCTETIALLSGEQHEPAKN